MTEGSFSSGEVLVGRFRLRRFLARGGMGEVYEAVDTELGERVAVKVVRPEYAEDPRVMEHFRREVQLARRITHPSVCRIYDISRHSEGDGELTLLSMELLGGETLAKRLRRDGPLDPSAAAIIAGQVIAGVAAAHARGIVHGDLKASNVFLVSETEGLRAVVTDFGLARVVSRAGPPDKKLAPLAGSLASLAPEVLDGQPAGPASDIYALGVLLFEMITGRLPFEGDCPTSMVASRLITDAPSPRRWIPELDEGWDRAIARCLARRPEERFTDCHELALALGLSGVPATGPDFGEPMARPWSKTRRRAVSVLGVTAAGILLALGFGWRPDLMRWSTRVVSGPIEGSSHGSMTESDRVWKPAIPDGVPPGRSADAYQLFLEGVRLHNDFKGAAAVELFERAVEIDPGFGLAWARLAAAYTNLGRPGAREITARALELGDQLDEAQRLYLSGLYHSNHLHELPRAIEDFEKVLRLDPEDGAAQHNLAMAYSRLERFDEALERQAILVRDGRGSPLAISNLAAYHVLLGQPAEARRLIEGLEQRLPANPWPDLQLGFLMLQTGDLEVAEQAFLRAGDRRPGELAVTLGRCMARLLEDDPESALGATGILAHSSEPAAPSVRLSCRQLALGLLGRSGQALAELDSRASEMSAEVRSHTELWRARWFFERGELDAGLRSALVVASQEEGRWVGDYATYLVGRIHGLAGRADEARQEAERLAGRGRRLAIPQIRRLADLLETERLLGEGRLREALDRVATLEAAVPTRLPLPDGVPNAGRVMIWELAARVHEMSEDVDQAARYHRQIVESGAARLFYPFVYVRSLGWLAEYHAARGELELAREWDRRFLGLWGSGDLVAQEEIDRALTRLAESTVTMGSVEG